MLALNNRTSPSPLKMLAFDAMASPRHVSPWVHDADELICFTRAHYLTPWGTRSPQINVWVNASTGKIIDNPPEHCINAARIVDVQGGFLSVHRSGFVDGGKFELKPAKELTLVARKVNHASPRQGSAIGPGGLLTPLSPLSPQVHEVASDHLVRSLECEDRPTGNTPGQMIPTAEQSCEPGLASSEALVPGHHLGRGTAVVGEDANLIIWDRTERTISSKWIKGRESSRT